MRKGKVPAPLGLKKERHDKIVARETQFTEKTYKKFIKAKWKIGCRSPCYYYW